MSLEACRSWFCAANRVKAKLEATHFKDFCGKLFGKRCVGRPAGYCGCGTGDGVTVLVASGRKPQPL